ncbi:DUF1177 domain-containing protein [Aquibacillus albus]|uniref:DUF1177 family protein n=1 Tax=Aquibacillus albus TaxID=1168171 RepID=A0ABS2N5N2_9BACI|nr:DUF1177 domain-containing protein [Aquibacillus albus]MBM7573446.1 hypothetical protein [Aquibacillus albus]
MSLSYAMQAMELLDDPNINGKIIMELFKYNQYIETTTKTVLGERGSTDFVKTLIKGENGKSAGGNAQTLGIVGRLGGIGARPSRTGLVSDADGAVSGIAIALKLANMASKGDRLEGDVYVTTHICPDAPTEPHHPVDFMGSPVDLSVMNQYEIFAEMDAIISIDTTKGNRIINQKGISISPTVKEGYILKVSDDLLRIMEMSTGQLPSTFPITTQDITPYGNGLYHINSILQPAVATEKPVVGLAIVAQSIVPGCATGASHEVDIAEAVRFTIEVAKEYTEGSISFYDEAEFNRLVELYGAMTVLQSFGRDVLA